MFGCRPEMLGLISIYKIESILDLFIMTTISRQLRDWAQVFHQNATYSRELFLEAPASIAKFSILHF